MVKIGSNILIEGEKYTVDKMYNETVWRLKKMGGGIINIFYSLETEYTLL